MRDPSPAASGFEAPSSDDLEALADLPKETTVTPPTNDAGKAPATPQTDRGHSSKRDDIVDLSDWTKEFQSEKKMQSGGQRTSDAPPKPHKTSPGMQNDQADPLSGLTEPASSPADAPASPKEKPSRSGPGSKQQPLNGFPVLIIVKGPGAGKKLPLVPVTMTVGREHDNNIELKDEEVARYHARISFERGQYVLEDLESSSGTWVNDEMVDQAVLEHGDKIRVGTTEMIIDFE